MDKLLKYVDDSKYFGIVKTEDDILLAQDKFNDLYGWAENNNMKWKKNVDPISKKIPFYVIGLTHLKGIN